MREIPIQLVYWSHFLNDIYLCILLDRGKRERKPLLPKIARTSYSYAE